jgi:hypothetical protein
MPPRGPWWGKCAALRREQLNDGDTGPILHGMKAGRSQGQYGVVASITRTVTDETGRPLWIGVYDNVPTDYSGQVALRKEQCDMLLQSQNLGIGEMLQRCSLLQSQTATYIHNSQGTHGGTVF